MSKSVLKPDSQNEQPTFKCPKCGTYTDYRIPRGVLVKTFFPFISLKRYWCPKCFNRFYIKAA